jgi:LuxR family maltose regulon positive regulatory protein
VRATGMGPHLLIPRQNIPSAADRFARFDTPIVTHVVDRPRLYGRLTHGLDVGTVLVAATAGWGKTLLAASWAGAAAGDLRTAWVTLDSGDDDERAFWRTLATALLGVADEAAGEGLRQLTAPGSTDLPSLFVAAVRRLQHKVVLVLDNLHEVGTPDVQAGLLQLVERPLPMLSLVVMSRSDPPWPLRRLRLAGLLSEVRAADLAFRTDEAAQLFEGLELGLSEEQVGRLVERTEGWPAGLRLGALRLLDCDDVDSAVDTFSGDDHDIAGYLLAEVLDRQAPDLLAFLQSVSVVDQVNAGLADALTGGDDGEDKLAELAASLLFVEATGRSGRWYRLHRMVADILRARQLPLRRRRDLHRRAAEWFRNHDMPLDAVALALRGELWPLAAELVGRYLLVITLKGEAHRLEQLLNEVPRTVVLSRPELAAGLAGARVVQGSGVEVVGLVDAARGGTPQLSPARAQRLGVVLDLIGGALARLAGDFDTMGAIYQQVPRGPAELARLGLAAVEIVPVLALNNLGTAELWAGDLHRAAEHLTATIEHGADGLTLPHLNAAAHLALLHCERGELTAAEDAAREVTAAAVRLGWAKTPQAVSAYLAMARVLLDRDELVDLDQWLQRVVDVESVAPEPHIQLALAIVLAAWRDASGDGERALTGLRATHEQLRPWTPSGALAEQWMLAEATLLVRLGDAAGARGVLTALGRPRTDAGAVALARLHLLLGDEPALPAVPNADPRVTVGLRLLEALSASGAGAAERGLARLEEALLAAAPSRMRRPFLVEEANLRVLLQQRIEQGSAVPAFAIDLLQRMSGSGIDELAVRRAVFDPLTEREQTVLRYLASALSNTEIAKELYLSVNTVKTHQRTIYRKLGAEGRRDAVRRARALRLL